MPKYDVISFLSDMGTVDESVGVCKAIMYQQAPHVNIFDITHDVPQFDVRAGALALTRAIQFMPKGIVVAAVDPGSPRDQRYIAVELAEGVLIGPDNGILAPATQLIGEPKRVCEITNAEYRIDAPGNVFAARDIMSPAAGVIANGTDIGELGNVIPLDQLVPGMLQLSRHDEGGALLGEVWSIDRFGNVQINITPEELEERNVNLGDMLSVRVGQKDFMAKYVERYADLAISQVGILIDSTGMMSIVKNHDYAARELDVKEGKEVIILSEGSTVTGRDITVEELVRPHMEDHSIEPAVISPQTFTPSPPDIANDFHVPVSGLPDIPENPVPILTNPPTQTFGSLPTRSDSQSGPVDPFASAPPAQQPQQPEPTAPAAPVWDKPSQPTNTGPVDPFATQTPPPADPANDAPASYFPPPVVEQPPVPTPDVAPAYGQQHDQVSQEESDLSGVPENVFDLFKVVKDDDGYIDPDADDSPQH